MLHARLHLFSHHSRAYTAQTVIAASSASLWHLSGQRRVASDFTGRFPPADYIPCMARDSLMRELSGLVFGQVRNALQKRSTTDIGPTADEPPVVAQLMIEIRSDGSRTIARGALNDLLNGESAKVHAEGRTPSDLILSLAGSLMALPGSLFDTSRKRREEQLEKDASPTPAADAKGTTGTSYYDRRKRNE